MDLFAQIVEWAKVNLVLVGLIFVICFILHIPFRNPKE